jgi:hypothetical protein
MQWTLRLYAIKLSNSKSGARAGFLDRLAKQPTFQVTITDSNHLMILQLCNISSYRQQNFSQAFRLPFLFVWRAFSWILHTTIMDKSVHKIEFQLQAAQCPIREFFLVDLCVRDVAGLNFASLQEFNI